MSIEGLKFIRNVSLTPSGRTALRGLLPLAARFIPQVAWVQALLEFIQVALRLGGYEIVKVQSPPAQVQIETELERSVLKAIQEVD